MTDRPAVRGRSPGLGGTLAVIAGFLTVVILTTVTDEIMHATGIIPRGPMWNPWHNALALAYRCVIGVAGGNVTARIAPSARMTWVVVLAAIGTFAATAGVVVTWGLAYGPHWYPVALALTAFPTVWFGGWLHCRGAARG